jgi:hypothetical protein
MLGLAPNLAAVSSDPANSAGSVRPDERRWNGEAEERHQNRDRLLGHVATPF